MTIRITKLDKTGHSVIECKSGDEARQVMVSHISDGRYWAYVNGTVITKEQLEPSGMDRAKEMEIINAQLEQAQDVMLSIAVAGG
jgi:hypothetical protein